MRLRCWVFGPGCHNESRKEYTPPEASFAFPQVDPCCPIMFHLSRYDNVSSRWVRIQAVTPTKRKADGGWCVRGIGVSLLVFVPTLNWTGLRWSGDHSGLLIPAARNCDIDGEPKAFTCNVGFDDLQTITKKTEGETMVVHLKGIEISYMRTTTTSNAVGRSKNMSSELRQKMLCTSLVRLEKGIKPYPSRND